MIKRYCYDRVLGMVEIHPKAVLESEQYIKYSDVAELEKLHPPMTEDCPECGGTGTDESLNGEIFNGEQRCKNCLQYTAPLYGIPLERGKLPIYYTPEQWEEKTGQKMLDSDPVWLYMDIEGRDDIACPGKKENYWTLFTCREDRRKYFKYIIIARPGQPAPPTDYRPEQP